MSNKNHPNVIIFNPDQWRGDVMGHLGDQAVQTPNLDAMVAESAISFRHAYCQNPVCTPSRCSFMTGWYPHTRGHRTMRHMLHREHGEISLLEVLREAGYYVWWGGKNDLIAGQTGYKGVADMHFTPTQEDLARWDYSDVDPSFGRKGPDEYTGPAGESERYGFRAGTFSGMPDGRLFPDIDVTRVYGAIDFLDNRQGDDKPFCAFLPIGNPHPPYGCEQRLFDAVDPEKMLSRVPRPQDDREPAMRSGIRQLQGLDNWTEQEWKEVRQLYYGQCGRVDELFGDLVDALKRNGEYDNTLIIILSDHGDYTGDYNMVEKNQNTFEDCLTRVPFIIKPPADMQIRPGVREQLAELIDMPATIYDVCGIKAPYDHFGRSVVPLFADDTALHRDAVFTQGGRLHGEYHCTENSNNPNLDPKNQYYPRQACMRREGPEHGKAAMCRTERYKYVQRLYEEDQLFDLKNDPHELVNQVNNPEYQNVLHNLERRMLRWYMETSDIVPYQIDDRLMSEL